MEFSEGSEDEYYVDDVLLSDEYSDTEFADGLIQTPQEEDEVFINLHAFR